jgi:hypothetical protein
VAGSSWRGRRLEWSPDRQAIEQERQRWVYERVEGLNELISTDPRRAYAEHRAAYILTGDLAQLRLALEYVQ